MKIIEVTNQSRKIIRRLHNLYISYIINPKLYLELLEMLNVSAQSTDLDIAREANIIYEKLNNELIRILSK